MLVLGALGGKERVFGGFEGDWLLGNGWRHFDVGIGALICTHMLYVYLAQHLGSGL